MTEGSNANLRPDARRLAYIMRDIDGFADIQKDRHHYAAELAERSGRDEPNAMDELNGFRLLIDDAMEADPHYIP